MKCLFKNFVALSAVVCILCTVQGAEETTTLATLTTSTLTTNEQPASATTSTTTSANITIDVSSTTQAPKTEAVITDTITTTAATTTSTTNSATTSTTSTTAATTAPTLSSTTTPTPASTSTSTSTTVEPANVTPKTAKNGYKKYYISDDIPTCQQKDLNLNDCIKRAFEIMLPRLKNGYQELNVPSIDPFTLNRTTFQFSSGPINGRITMHKAKIFGLAGTKFNAVDFKVINNNSTKFHMTSGVPLVTIAGGYKADVAFNNVRMKPRGTFNVTLTNISMVQTAEGSFYEKDDHRFLRLSKHEVQPKIGGLKLQATGLLPDPTLNDIVVNFANQYWREIYRIMLAETRQFWGPRLLSMINESLAAVPYDLLVKID